MSLNSVVNNLVRAAAGIKPDISDADLDAHVAKLLAEEAKAKEMKWGELGLAGLIGGGSGLNRGDSPDPTLPKTNKRFLASVIRTVDGHNHALLRQQAQSAREARNDKLGESSTSNDRNRSASERRNGNGTGTGTGTGSAASRLFGGAVRSMGAAARSDKGKERERERDSRVSVYDRRHHGDEVIDDRGDGRHGDPRSARGNGQSYERYGARGESGSRYASEGIERSQDRDRHRARDRTGTRDRNRDQDGDGDGDGDGRYRDEERSDRRQHRDALDGEGDKARDRVSDGNRERDGDHDHDRRAGDRHGRERGSGRSSHGRDEVGNKDERRIPRSPEHPSRKASSAPAPSGSDSSRFNFNANDKPKPSIDPSPTSQRKKQRSPTPTPTPTPSPPPPPLERISKMDKYFSSTYDPRTDLPTVPSEGLIQEVGWDNMLAILKERGQKKRRHAHSPSLSDTDPLSIPAPPQGVLPTRGKRSYSPSRFKDDQEIRRIERKERKARRVERRERRRRDKRKYGSASESNSGSNSDDGDGDLSSGEERERARDRKKRKERKREKEKEKDAKKRDQALKYDSLRKEGGGGPGTGSGILDGYDYVKKGGTRAWDVGK
ncbi:hypothetical protein IAU59_007289 [Kwoniella sp. CBS 9459]